jgi:hypothetical protein
MMQFSNYPAGVSDAHPHFNPEEVELEVACEAEEMELVPSFWVKAQLLELRQLVKTAEDAPSGARWEAVPNIGERIQSMLEAVYELEDNGTYDCPFKGPLTLDVSEEAEWDCQICGTAHKVDTVPEAQDPDSGWDGRHE